MGKGKPMNWAIGITTVPERRDSLIRTVNSLKAAGFENPRLFIDANNTVEGMDTAIAFFPPLEFSIRVPRIKIFGNWILGLWELYIRNPGCHRYAIFQDDLVACKNLRRYMEASFYPENSYFNLYTLPSNLKLAPKNQDKGWFLSDQYGRSAVALVFSRDTVTTLCKSEHMAHKPLDPIRGHRTVDGAVSQALCLNLNWKEYVHIPSLVQHTGVPSTIGNEYQGTTNFVGEDFDAMELLK
jgi:hypothetical protein